MTYASLFLFKKKHCCNSQRAKVLLPKEIWSSNRANNIHEDIFCDHGDDILSRPKTEEITKYITRAYSSHTLKNKAATFFLTVLFILTVGQITAQQKFHISGTIKDSAGLPLPGATVLLSGYQIGNVANAEILATVPTR